MTIRDQTFSIKKPRRSSLLTTGFALFSMFFGAGNLIFPLMIGQSVGSNVWYAIAGLSITAVLVPFLGLAAMILFQGDYLRFFGRLGKIPGVILLLLLQLILGPFGVIPRLITLMHAMSKPYLFDISLGSFSVIAAAVIFGCSFKRGMLIHFLGILLTPLLLLSLSALIFFGVANRDSTILVSMAPSESFLQGLLGGYNTMDLIAAFLFATVVLPHFQKETEGEFPLQRRSSLLKKMCFSSCIAAGLLLLSYVGLCLIASCHSVRVSCPPETMLSEIAIQLLGPAGGGIAAMAVIIACLTTAMTLAAIFADYLRQDLLQKKISPLIALILTLAVTVLFANLGFSGIASFLGPILQIVYPGLIVLTVFNLLHNIYGWQIVKTPVFLAFAAACFYFA